MAGDTRADNGSQSLIGVSFALLTFTTVFFVLFLVSRYYHEAAVGWLMFWLIVFAYIFNTGNAVDNACTFPGLLTLNSDVTPTAPWFCTLADLRPIVSAILGDAGKHVETLDHHHNIASGKIGKAADYLYIPSAILPKLAMLALFHQIFPGRIHQYLIYANVGLLTCTLLAGLLQTTFICHPFSAYWTGDGKCGDLMATYRWLSYPNLFTDIVMLIMPFPVLLRLQVSSATKVKLVITFLTGSL